MLCCLTLTFIYSFYQFPGLFNQVVIIEQEVSFQNIWNTQLNL